MPWLEWTDRATQLTASRRFHWLQNDNVTIHQHSRPFLVLSPPILLGRAWVYIIFRWMAPII